MRLVPRRPSAAVMATVPDRPLLPTESLTATVTLADQLDEVLDARIELGYVNTYTYEWARGGYNPGGYKDASDWVHVLDEPLVFAGGTLPAGSHAATLRLPSWSPPSSDLAIEWQVRLNVVRRGKTPESQATVAVLAPSPDPPPDETRLVQGERALANSIRFEIVTDARAYRVGSQVRGTISVTPTEPVTRTATADVRFYRPQISHPLQKPPAPRTDWFTRPHVMVAENVTLAQGVTTDIPFAAELPIEAVPTTEAVHNSIEWWVVATVTFAGLTGSIERARREIIVYNA